MTEIFEFGIFHPDPSGYDGGCNYINNVDKNWTRGMEFTDGYFLHMIRCAVND
jgi:hypothetical protein